MAVPGTSSVSSSDNEICCGTRPSSSSNGCSSQRFTAGNLRRRNYSQQMAVALSASRQVCTIDSVSPRASTVALTVLTRRRCILLFADTYYRTTPWVQQCDAPSVSSTSSLSSAYGRAVAEQTGS